MDHRSLPSELHPLVTAQRERLDWNEHLHRAVGMLEERDLPWRVRHALEQLVAWLGDDSDELTRVLERWVREDETLRSRAIEVLKHTPWGETFQTRARVLIQAADDPRLRWGLVLAHEPTSFVGSWEPYYRAEAKRFEPWLDDPVLREVAQQAIDYFTARADEAAADDRAEDFGY
jgi:hypothetical protein